MKKIVLILITLLFIAGCSSPIETTGGLMSSQEAFKASQKNTGVLIVDVRTPQEYAEGHIANSINLPLDQLKEVASNKLPDKEQSIYVVCRSGNRSSQAQDILESIGYTSITDIGSVFDWPEALIVSP